MHAHNAAAYLERSLPLVLSQDYPCFEVLVVVDSCTDLTAQRLEQMEMRWPSLRHITIPASAWHPNRHRLAVALGAKAALYDWVMVLQPEYAPQSTRWLAQMATAIVPDVERVLGFTAIEAGDTERFVTSFEQWLTLTHCRSGVEDSNTLILRELLISNGSARTVSAIHPDAVVCRTLPYGNVWWSQQLRRMRLHNAGQSLSFRFLHTVAVWQFWLVAAVSAILCWQHYWWAGLMVFMVWLLATMSLFASFCRALHEKAFYLSYLYRIAVLPLLRL